MTVTALVICAADEHGDFEDPLVPRRRFAAADARATAALASDVTLLIGQEATLQRVRKALKRFAAKGPDEGPTLVYYVGYGRGGQLVCHDSPAAADLTRKALPGSAGGPSAAADGECLPLDELEDALAAHAGPTLLLLDAGAEADDTPPLDTSGLTAAWMAAAAPGEESHESLLLKRGVWSHHVLEELSRPGADAKEAARAVSQAVPRTLRTESSTVKKQSPAAGGPLAAWSLGGTAAAESSAAAPSGQGGVEGLTLTSARRVRVKELSGFRKGWTVPDAKTDYWDSKAAGWTESELEDDLSATFAALKDAFRFKRRDLDKRGPDGGHGTLVTPGFDYNVWSELDADDPARVLFRREVTKISDPALVLSDAFETVFGSSFEAVSVRSSSMIDVESVIDRIEDREDDSVRLDYDADCTYCEVSFEGRTAVARVTADGLTIRDPEAPGVRALLESAAEVRRDLADALGA